MLLVSSTSTCSDLGPLSEAGLLAGHAYAHWLATHQTSSHLYGKYNIIYLQLSHSNLAFSVRCLTEIINYYETFLQTIHLLDIIIEHYSHLQWQYFNVYLQNNFAIWRHKKLLKFDCLMRIKNLKKTLFQLLPQVNAQTVNKKKLFFRFQSCVIPKHYNSVFFIIIIIKLSQFTAGRRSP